MKVIIAGSRHLADLSFVEKAISDSKFQITEVVSGGAVGIDLAGEKWAVKNNLPVKQFLPDWKRLGKSAGPIRNAEMAKYADAAIAIWDGVSRGTKNLIDNVTRKNLPVYVYRIPPKENNSQEEVINE